MTEKTIKARPHPRVPYFCTGESLTHQSFAAEVNINTIMDKYAARGILDHVNQHQGSYGDMPSETDYHANLQSVMDANDAFASLPAAIRSRFDNDPGKFLGFVQDPKNQHEIDKMGLGEQSASPEAKEVETDPKVLDPKGDDADDEKTA